MRSENYQSTTHGRDHVQDVEMAATKDGKILGFGALPLFPLHGREHAGNDRGFFWTSYAWNGVAVFLAAMLVAAFALGGIS